MEVTLKENNSGDKFFVGDQASHVIDYWVTEFVKYQYFSAY